MAKENQTKVVEWKEVIELASTDSGIPKKQLEEDSVAIDKSIKSLLTSKQPKRDNESLEIKTPFTLYHSTRLPETVITDSAGHQVTRPSCCEVNLGIPRSYVDAANIGLVDKDTAASGKAAKSA